MLRGRASWRRALSNSTRRPGVPARTTNHFPLSLPLFLAQERACHPERSARNARGAKDLLCRSRRGRSRRLPQKQVLRYAPAPRVLRLRMTCSGFWTARKGRKRKERRVLKPSRRRERRHRNSGFGLRSKILSRIDEPISLEIVLLVVQLFVATIRNQQLLVRPPLYDLSVLEHQNLIGAPNRREPVRNHKRRPPAP